MTDTNVPVSVVVPVKDEAGNAAKLAREIAAALKDEGAFEIVFGDDGSSDGTADELLALRPELVLLQKTMVQVEGVARRLDPRHDLWAAARPISSPCASMAISGTSTRSASTRATSCGSIRMRPRSRRC